MNLEPRSQDVPFFFSISSLCTMGHYDKYFQQQKYHNLDKRSCQLLLQPISVSNRPPPCKQCNYGLSCQWGCNEINQGWDAVNRKQAAISDRIVPREPILPTNMLGQRSTAAPALTMMDKNEMFCGHSADTIIGTIQTILCPWAYPPNSNKTELLFSAMTINHFCS